MKIQVIIAEYVGSKLIEHECNVETGAQCIELLSELEGKTKTLITFSRNNWDLMIGGGGESGYIANVWNQEQENGYVLRNQIDDTGEEVDIVSGGQRGVWDKASVLSYDSAAQALITFIQTGERDSNLIWVKDE